MKLDQLTFLMLGSNLGDRKSNLLQAQKALGLHVEIIKSSKIYVSRPMAGLQQPDFYNQALIVRENFLPEDLLILVKNIERALGRVPAARWAARIIDIDIIFKGSSYINSANLKIPHFDYQNRIFALKSMAEIAPDFVPIMQDKSLVELLAICEQKNNFCEEVV